MESENTFFAMMARMKFINRWALMRNSYEENISEHSMEVAMIAHALAIIGNKRLGRRYPAEKIAMIGLYHDCTEIITGDMPTPIKYKNDKIQEAYKEIEAGAARRLLQRLPKDLRDAYEPYLLEAETDEEWRRWIVRRQIYSARNFCRIIIRLWTNCRLRYPLLYAKIKLSIWNFRCNSNSEWRRRT